MTDFEKKSFEEISEFVGKLDNISVRRWYLYHDRHIHEEIDSALPLEEKARIAFDLRNKYRTQARALMADKKRRAELDRNNPNPTFESILNHKINDKGMSYEEAIQDIYNTAVKTNSIVNRILKLE